MTYDEILATIRTWPLEEQIRLIDEIYRNVVNSGTAWAENMLQSNWPEIREQMARAADLKLSSLS